MIIERNINQYPYKGEFYQLDIDDSLPLNEQIETKKTICIVDCDIQKDNDTIKENSLHCSYSVFVKFDKNEDIKVKRGMLFTSSQYGLIISGKVTSVSVSELGGFVATINTIEM